MKSDSKTEIIGRDEYGRFTAEQEHGGPGRKPGSLGGRQLALRALDAVIGREKNIAKLKGEFQTKFWANPLLFFRMYVMPLLPKQIEGSGFDMKTMVYNLINFSGNGSKPDNPEKEVNTERAGLKAIIPPG